MLYLCNVWPLYNFSLLDNSYIMKSILFQEGGLHVLFFLNTLNLTNHYLKVNGIHQFYEMQKKLDRQ